MNMSDIHKCGFCDLLVGLVRRVLCASIVSRRGSSETGYRELGDRSPDSLSAHHERLRKTSESSSEAERQTVTRVTFKDEVEIMFSDPVPHTSSGEVTRHLGDFKSMERRKPKTRSFTSQAEVDLEVTYPKQLKFLLANCGQWSFDSHTLDKATSGRCLPELSMHLFNSYGLIDLFKLCPENCWKLFHLIEQNYHGTNPYHNAVHAADVTQAMHCFLQQQQLLDHMQPLEIMVVLLAAMCHDLDHPGVSHGFLVATEHPLAVIFKDKGLGARDRSPMMFRRGRKGRKLRELMRDLASAKGASLSTLDQATSSSEDEAFLYEERDCQSILEHHHWRMGYSCILESGIYAHMPEHLPTIKRLLRSLILATDISRQSDYLHRFNRHLSRNKLDMRRADHRLLVLQMALKTADISNPGRPWLISQRWTTKVCCEFYRQGDQEINQNIEVSPLCNRYTDTVQKIQIGFFRNIVMPLYVEWNNFLNSDLSRDMMKNLIFNEAKWTSEDHRSASRTNTEPSTSGALTKITDADELEFDLETSTYFSGSSEMLIPCGSETSGKRSRRQSYSPKSQGSMMNVIRRYSAPLHLFNESQSLKRHSIPERTESPAPATATPTPPPTNTLPAAIDKNQKEAHNDLLKLSEYETESEVAPLITDIMPRPVLDSTLDKLNRLMPGAFIKEEFSTSSSFSPNGCSISHQQVLNTCTTSIQTSSSESRGCLTLNSEKPSVATNRTMSSSELYPSPRSSESEDYREVPFPHDLTARRGSAPAAGRVASHMAGRANASSCQRLSVEVSRYARRGSLPVEAMQGIST